MSARAVAGLLLALLSAQAGITLALNHPLWPLGLLALLACVAVLEAAVPGAWLLLVPACLPFMNFSPWTGWIAFEELDIVLLAVLAGAYGRTAWQRLGPPAVSQRRGPALLHALLVALALTGVLSLVRGVTDAGGWAFDWFGAYAHPMNSVRVFKSLGFAWLLWPLMAGQLRANAARAERLFSLGMALGLAWVCLAVLWERAGFVGLLDFSSNYRTVATFWEMHVGGAAIDAYLAMATPFALWALVSARRPLWWGLASALTLLAGYACLTTFSRGVYLAVGLQLLLLLLALLQRSTLFTRMWARWKVRGMLVVAALLLAEVVAVSSGDSFMHKRVSLAAQDMGSRLAHWQAGVDLLQSPLDAWLGKGLGRIPANYAAQVPDENFPGSVDLQTEVRQDGSGNRYAVLRAPDNLEELPGLYALTQRVVLTRTGVPTLHMDVRAEQPADLTVLLCQRHLLYDRACQGVAVEVKASGGAWQTVRLPLGGPPLGTGSRPITFAISLDTPGGVVAIDNVQLSDAWGSPLLTNGDFSRDMAQWLPAAQSYYVPWHIDNLYLEVLIERGWLGFLLLGPLLVWAMAMYWLMPAQRCVPSTAMAAGLLGVLVVGLVSSVLDVPRIGLLFYLLPLLLLGKRIRL